VFLLTLRKVLLISSVVFVVLLGVLFLLDKAEESKLREIDAKMDHSLTSFTYAKSIASSMREVLIISDTNDYGYKRSKYRSLMSDSVWREYFPSENFSPARKAGYSIESERISGEILGSGYFLFKLDWVVRDGDLSYPVTLLVTVRDGVITKVESLG